MFDITSMLPDTWALLQPIYEAAVLTALVVLLTRINGLKSFAVMSSFDFAVTIALGSTIASVITSKETGLLVGGLAIIAIFLIQKIITEIRKRSDGFARAIDTRPLLLMQDGEIFYDNLNAANITEGDLAARMRMASVQDPANVQAVIFETTGEISVLQRQPNRSGLEDLLLKGVRRTP